ncbi:molybdenum cofactor guanylyltransferase MobA [Aquibaculum sediminis]|uniref:molybdenum cofactor guanylyltransferase MobA n=1 Tax=Aquibaculum sediminis TaxID=3231907 RepID=UPI0034532A34
MASKLSNLCGVLLAGGQSRRMGGGDKCLRPLGGRPLLARIIERARPQVGPLVINANGDPTRFEAFGLPVVPDSIGGFAGPLAGVLTGMEWAREHAPDCPWIVTFAGDAPFFPQDLVARLAQAREDEGADIVCAASGGRDHPVFALWPVALADSLRAAMEADVRKVDVFTADYRLVRVDWPVEPYDPFFNANRPEDWAEAERLFGSEAGEGAAPSAAQRGGEA